MAGCDPDKGVGGALCGMRVSLPQTSVHPPFGEIFVRPPAVHGCCQVLRMWD